MANEKLGESSPQAWELEGTRRDELGSGCQLTQSGSQNSLWREGDQAMSNIQVTVAPGRGQTCAPGLAV